MVSNFEGEHQQVIVYLAVIDLNLKIDAIIKFDLLCNAEWHCLFVHCYFRQQINLWLVGLRLLDKVAEEKTEDRTAQGGRQD